MAISKSKNFSLSFKISPFVAPIKKSSSITPPASSNTAALQNTPDLLPPEIECSLTGELGKPAVVEVKTENPFIKCQFSAKVIAVQIQMNQSRPVASGARQPGYALDLTSECEENNQIKKVKHSRLLFSQTEIAGKTFRLYLSGQYSKVNLRITEMTF